MRTYRSVWISLVLLLLCCMIATPALGQSGGGLDLILLLDSTGSTADTDPGNLRLASAQFLLDYVQAVGEVQGVTHRFAAANFNTATLDEIPWTPLQGDAGREQLVARSVGGTDFKPALEYALRLRQQPGGAEKLAVVLFTDGAPCPASPCPQGAALNAYFKGLEDTVAALQATGAEIFVVALGDDSTKANWSALVGASHYRFVDASTDLAGVYHDFFADLLGLGAEAARPLHDGDSTTITVEPYLEQLVLSIIKTERGAQVTVTDPFGGSPLPTRGGADALHVVYAIPSPAAGRWQVRVTGGAAQVYVDRQYATLALDAPTAPQALGAPIQVTGQLLRRGVVIRDDSDLRLSVTATGPDQTTTTLDLARRADGRYQGALTGLTVEGSYTLTLSGEWAGQPVGARQTEVVTVSLFAAPRLGALEIQGEAVVGRPLTVTVAIANAERIGPETEVFARLLRADNSTVDAPALRDDGVAPDAVAGDGIFSARLTLPMTEGRYRVDCVLQGSSRDGVALDAITPQVVADARSSLPTPTATVTPVITPTPTPSGGFDVPDLGRRYPWLGIGLGIGLIVAGYLGYQASRYRREWQYAETSWANETARADTEKTRADNEAMRADTEKIRADQECARANAAENTFLKQAEEWYRKGQEHSSKAEYEEAKEAYAQYFEILKQGFEKLQIDIMPNLSQAAAGLFETLKHLPASERNKTLLEQARLVITPELDAARFSQMAYALPDLWKSEEAVENLYALFAQGGQREPLLKAIAETGKPPLAAIAQTLQLAIEDPTPERLRRVAADAEPLDDKSGLGIKAVAEWLQSLAQYSAPSCLLPDEAKSVIEVLEQFGPSPLIDLVTITAQGLITAPTLEADERLQDYWRRVNDYLETGLAQLRQRVNMQLPEARIVFKLTHRWLLYVQEQRENLMQPPDIQVDLLPMLAQTQREEELKRDYWLVDVPVNLFNTGERPALDVVVTVHANYGSVMFLPNSQQEIVPEVADTQSHPRFQQRLSGLLGGQARHLTFRMEAQESANCRLQIDVKYVEEKAAAGTYQRLEKQCAAQYLEIAPLMAPKPALPTSNPYTTGPLLNDVDWEQMGKAQAPQTVQEIVATLENLHTTGRFLQIVGLRRTGKTTILKRVLRAAEKLTAANGAPQFICVYLDLNRWLEEIEPYRSRITEDSALWHAILNEIYHECESQLPGALRDRISQALQIGKRFSLDSDPPCLPEVSIREFSTLLRDIQRVTKRTLCLALDEGDVLADLQPTLEYQGTVRGPLASTPLTRIMSALQGIVEDRDAVVLLARGYGETIWEQDAARTGNTRTFGRTDIWNTHLLDENETLSIADLGKFQFTDLGRKTFWQLTGGYPLLVQVLGDYLYKQRAAGFLSGAVSNGVIKRALFDIMTTPAGAETLDFMRYGFKREEEMVLKTLAVRFTDYTTGFVQEVVFHGGSSASISGTESALVRLPQRWPQTWENLAKDRLVQIIDRLKGKELLEVQNFRLRWRVGWLCLLMQEVMVEEETSEESNLREIPVEALA